MGSKQINTTIPADLHKIALLKEISWSKALQVGIKQLAAVDTKEQEIKEKIAELQTTIKLLEASLQEIVTHKEEEKILKALEESKKENFCSDCNNVNPTFKFKEKILCRACFMRL